MLQAETHFCMPGLEDHHHHLNSRMTMNDREIRDHNSRMPSRGHRKGQTRARRYSKFKLKWVCCKVHCKSTNTLWMLTFNRLMRSERLARSVRPGCQFRATCATTYHWLSHTLIRQHPELILKTRFVEDMVMSQRAADSKWLMHSEQVQ